MDSTNDLNRCDKITYLLLCGWTQIIFKKNKEMFTKVDHDGAIIVTTLYVDEAYRFQIASLNE